MEIDARQEAQQNGEQGRKAKAHEAMITAAKSTVAHQQKANGVLAAGLKAEAV